MGVACTRGEGEREMRKGLKWRNLRETDQFEERPRGQDNSKKCLEDVGGKGMADIHVG
jgi:hypothetical protein